MSENTNSTNVDSGKNDKYLEIIKDEIPVINCCCEGIGIDDEKILIVVDKELSGSISGNTIRDFGEVDILVNSLPRKEYEKFKNLLMDKSKQTNMPDKKEEIDSQR